MNLAMSYLTMFYILDPCYFICEEDCLGMFLGMLDPEIWADGMPADPVMIKDWKKYLDGAQVDEQNIFSYTVGFLKYYGKRLDFDFTKTEEILQTQVDDRWIQRAIAQAKEKYARHDYSRYE